MRQGRAKEIADLHASSDREVGQRLTFAPGGRFLPPPAPSKSGKVLGVTPHPAAALAVWGFPSTDRQLPSSQYPPTSHLCRRPPVPAPNPPH